MPPTLEDASRSLFVFAKDVNTGKISRVAIPSDFQVGLNTSPADLTLFGRFSINVAQRTIGNSSKLSILDSDTVVCVNKGLATTRIIATLPSTPREGQLHFIKDNSGTALSVPIDVYPFSTSQTIDGSTYVTLATNYGSLCLFWSSGHWHVFANSSSGGTGNLTATIFTLNNESATLTQSRRLLFGSAFSTIDAGSGSNYTVNLASVVAGGSYTVPNLTVDSYGRITSISNGTTPAPVGASYVTLGTDATLTNERVLTSGWGINIVDGGSNNNVTVNLGNNIAIWYDATNKIYTTASVAITKNALTAESYGTDTYFFVSGSQSWPYRGLGVQPNVSAFGGDVIVSGSLWLATGGIRLSAYSPNGTNTPSQFIIAGASGSGIGFTDSTSGTLFQVSDPSGLPLLQINDNDTLYMGEPYRNTLVLSGSWAAFGTVPTDKNYRLYVSGSQRIASGSLYVEGPIIASSSTGGQITGSITKTSLGTSYIVGGSGVSVTSNSVGQVIISFDTSSAGFDTNASYLMLGSSSLLNNERIFSVSGTSGLIMSDAGANSTLSLRINDNIVATLSGSIFTGQLKVTGASGLTTISGGYVTATSLSGSLTRLFDGTSYLIAGSNITITSSSNGSIKIDSTGGGGAGSWVDGVGRLYTTGSVSVDSRGLYADQIGSNIFQFFSGTVGLTGTNGSFSSFGGDVNISGSTFVGVLSASLTDRHVIIRSASVEFDDLHRLEYPPSASYLTWYGGYRTKFGQIGINTNNPSASLHVVGIPFDGTFETYEIGALDKQPFYTYGNLPWARTSAQANGGTYSAGSGPILVSSASSLACQFLAGTSWRPTFYQKTSISTSDTLKFYIDGNLQTQWSGTQGWTSYVGNWSAPGLHTLLWTYTRNNTGGSNLTWVDDVIIQMRDDVPTNIAAVFESGSVGVGVTVPQAQFHVSGSTILQGNVTITSGTLSTRYITGSLTTLQDGTSYILAGTGIQVTTASNGSITVATIGGGGTGAKVPIHTLQVATAVQTTNYLSSSKKSIGACYWDPTIMNQFSGTKQIKWNVVIEAADTSYPVAVDLYDVNGVLYGIPGIVTGSILTTNSLGPAVLSADITQELTSTLTPVLFEGRMWMTVSSSTGMYVTCKNARLDILFS